MSNAAMTGPQIQADCLGGTEQLFQGKERRTCAHATYANMAADFQQAPSEAAPFY